MSSPNGDAMHGERGRVLQVNVSPGGVPKLPVAEARVERYGLEGDGHLEPTVHGGPHRAVALFAIEAIRRVAAEGHPIAPGTAGENLTTEGIEIAALPIGTRLAIGDELVVEISAPDNPCDTIRGSFSDRRFGRISIVAHPLDSRMYARVIAPGVVRPNDPIAVLPPAADSRASELSVLARLDDAHRASALAIWRAAIDAGVDLRIVDDHEVALSAQPGVRGGMWNTGLGFAGLPNIVGMGLEHFRSNDADGWLELDPADPEAAGLSPVLEHAMFAALPGDVATATVIDGLTVRAIAPDEGASWARLLAAVDGLPSEEADAWIALAPHLAQAAHATLLLAELDGDPVGTAILHTHRKAGWLRAGAVIERGRGRGVHRALIAERARLAAAAGCDVIGAEAEPGSASAANLRAMGFREVGRRGRYPAGLFESTATVAARARESPASRP